MSLNDIDLICDLIRSVSFSAFVQLTCYRFFEPERRRQSFDRGYYQCLMDLRKPEAMENYIKFAEHCDIKDNWDQYKKELANAEQR